MAAISSSAGYQAVTQDAYRQFKVQQARQDAERAEDVARMLAMKAGEARRVADQAEENARSLTVQSDQAQTVAGQARQGVAMLKAAGNMQVQLSNTVDQVVERAAEGSAAESEVKSIAPVVNTSGQVTGTVVNTTA